VILRKKRQNNEESDVIYDSMKEFSDFKNIKQEGNQFFNNLQTCREYVQFKLNLKIQAVYWAKNQSDFVCICFRFDRALSILNFLSHT